MAEVLAGAEFMGWYGGLLLGLACFSCVFYVFIWLLWLVEVMHPRWRSSSAGNSDYLAFHESMVLPVIGYFLGAAVTLIPGASGWSLAPQYGIILGVAGALLLDAVRSALMPLEVKGGTEAERLEERVTNPE